MGGKTQLEQREGRNFEPCAFFAAIDEHGDRGGFASIFSDNVQAFDDAAATGDHIFDYENLFPGGELEPSSQDQDIVFLFSKNVTGFRLARDLLADDEAAHRRRENGCEGDFRPRMDLSKEEFGETGDRVHVLADLGALEVVFAMKARTEDKMPTEKGFRAGEDFQNLCLLGVHFRERWRLKPGVPKGFLSLQAAAIEQRPSGPCTVSHPGHTPAVVIERTPLEDELGDVLDKALRRCGITEAVLAQRSGVPESKIRDAIDYRYELDAVELNGIASVLGLNEIGFRAIAEGRYPVPEVSGLPFCLYPLRMPHGIGVANAYVVADCSRQNGILFDAGPSAAGLRRLWPARIRDLDAVFVTHAETEHVGGLEEARMRGSPPVFAPPGSSLPGSTLVGEGAKLEFAGFTVEVWGTPGHAEAHNCYLVRATAARAGTALLVSGDLIFAGSVGSAFFCRDRMQASTRRIFHQLPPSTVIAPGHGPLTTLENERAYNPFAV